MICYVCNIGEYKTGKVNTPLTRGGKVILITDVPALVCNNCGSFVLEEEALDITLKVANEFYTSGKQTSIVQYERFAHINQFIKN